MKMPSFRRDAALARAPDVRRSPALWRSGIVDWIGRHPIVERQRTAFGAWWGNRTPRERLMLLALAGTAATALIIAGIYRPLSAARARAAADIATYQVLAAQLRVAGPELARLRAIDRGASATTVASSASGFGLNVTPTDAGGGEVRLLVRDASFIRLVEWLVQAEGTTTFRISEVRIDRAPQPGIVNAQVTLRR